MYDILWGPEDLGSAFMCLCHIHWRKVGRDTAALKRYIRAGIQKRMHGNTYNDANSNQSLSSVHTIAAW